MQVNDTGKLMRAILYASRIVVNLRAMSFANEFDWIRGYMLLLERIDNLEPQIFDAIASAFTSLLLMHNGTAHYDWLRPIDKRARKTKKKRKTKKRKSKKNKNDDDDDDDNSAERSDADNDDDQDARKVYESTITASERAELDEAIDASGSERPVINVDSMSVTPLEEFIEGYETFIPYVQPLVFEASKSDRRPHNGIDYGLLMAVQVCGLAADIEKVLKKCRKQLVALRRDCYARLGYTSADEMPCRIMLLLWDGKLSEAKQQRLRTSLRKSCAELNTAREQNITYEFFGVAQLQYDVTKGNYEQFTVLRESDDGSTNMTPDEQRRLKTVKTFQMRKLETSDPQAAVRDLKVGQRVRIKRSHVHLGGESVEYAQVVDSTA